MLATKVFAKAGLNKVTSAMCNYQQRFCLDVQCSALVHNFNNIFSNGHLCRAGESMNSLSSQILERNQAYRTAQYLEHLKSYDDNETHLIFNSTNHFNDNNVLR